MIEITRKVERRLRTAYRQQRWAAKDRGIAFLLSWDQWLDVWIKSGRLCQRGRAKGQYCMARNGDMGPYSVDNVQIILHSENVRDWLTGRRLPLIVKRKIANAMTGRKVVGRKMAAWARAEISARMMGNTNQSKGRHT